MKRTKHANANIFINLILPYTCVLLVPVLIWTLSNLYVMKNNEKKMIDLVRSNLENSVNMADANLSQIEDVIWRISQNSAFRDFYEKSDLSFAEITNYQQIVSSYFIENGLVSDLYLYSAASGFLIDQKGFYRSIQDFVTVYHPVNSKTALEREQDFMNRLWLNGYDAQTEFSGERASILALPYTRTIPVEHPTRREGSVAALVNVENLLSSFDSLLDSGGGEMHVLTKGGDVIMSRGENCLDEALKSQESGAQYKKVRAGGRDIYQFTMISPKNSWRYHVFIDRDFIIRDMAMVNHILSAVNILAFVLGCLLCVYFTYGRNKSYLRIMHMLGIEKKTLPISSLRTNEFEFWKPYIGNLLDENRRIKENMDKLGEQSDYKVLHLLLFGGVGDEKAARSLVMDSGLKLDGKYFMVLALRSKAVYNIEGESNKNIFISHALEEFLDGQFYIYIADAKTMTVLLNFDTEPELFRQQLKKRLVNMNLEVFHRYRMEVQMGIGETADSLCGIENSYSQALEVVSYCHLTDSKDKLFYGELPQEQIMYFYPIEMENALFSAISCGKSVEAIKILNTIYEENFSKRSLSAARVSELIGEIYSSLAKMRHTYFKDEEFADYRLSDFTIKSFFEYARDFVFATCENMKVFEENAHNAQFKQMLEYINKNYGNCGLSRDSLAEAFGLTDNTYISKMFKKFMNENFSTYLERIRMEKACDLLSKRQPVKDVAEAVGYLSDISFRRAFKKRMGMSPSEYAARQNVE